jgi:hypothetical protein
MAHPDAASGGSYVGFADVGMASGMEAEVVPDRFDDPESTVSRPRAEGAPMGGMVGQDAFQGPFEQEFDLVDEVPAGPSAADRSEEGPAWSPPPEAPPMETWQSIDEPSEVERPASTASESPISSAPATPATAPSGDGRGVALTSEMIDLIADKVVERLADRVVREIAWEVVPGVAETLVRRRIKELEDSHSG